MILLDEVLVVVRQGRPVIFAIAAGLYLACALYPWHDQISIRRATGIVLVTLVLWITEVAPLGVVAMAIPIAATFAGLLSWKDAVAAWGDEIIFLFLGAFLLARALEKHAVFDGLLGMRMLGGGGRRSDAWLVLVVLAVSGVLSTMQNNTAVTAMMLPLVITMSRRSRTPAALLIALAWGATFGGMATPVGTAPNFIGYAAMKKLDATVSFVSWMKVGVPVWLGTTLIGWGVLRLATAMGRGSAAARRNAPGIFDDPTLTDVGPMLGDDAADRPAGSSRPARRWVIGAFITAILLWLVPGIVKSVTSPDEPAAIWIRTYLPESLVPIALAWVLFVVRPGPDARPILDRRDFQALDWDTLFLIAGGLTLGRMLETSGFAGALAQGLAGVKLPPLVLMLALAFATVLLSELTSNTATASLMVPIAGSLAEALSISPVQAIWLVSLAASLGFALPISTPPNAIVYGTRRVPLRFMAATGIVVDILATVWLVCCVTMLG
ncbi:MAG TPA: SLC13 family permease [Phycisphaerae bacterium]|nr:SLC13 family permease [Phycisphaerae bacterium]